MRDCACASACVMCMFQSTFVMTLDNKTVSYGVILVKKIGFMMPNSSLC